MKPPTQQAFETLNWVLALLHFKVFKVVCDASGDGSCVVLTQGGTPITYFREKLNETRLN